MSHSANSVSQAVEAVHRAIRRSSFDYLKQREIGLHHLRTLAENQWPSFLAANLRRFGLNYNLTLLLLIPELWQGFSSEEWQSLFVALEPRPSIQDWDLSELLGRGEYADIFFLIRWLNIDALQLAIQVTELSLAEKKKILVYAVKCSSIIMHDGAPIPISSDCQQTIQQVRNYLISLDDRLDRNFTDGHALLEYAHSLFVEM